MKRLLVLGLMVAGLGVMKSWAEGGRGSLPEYAFKLQRSSASCGVSGWVQFSSGPVVFHQIDISSPSYAYSSITLGRSTRESFLAEISTIVGPINALASTYTSPHWVDVIASSYSYVFRSGTACTTIYWDWYDGIFANPTPADSGY